MISLAPLARYARPRGAGVVLCCDLCGGVRRPVHRHVVESGQRGVNCVCEACAILFAQPARATRFKTVPDRVRVNEPSALSAAQWSDLGFPVGLAYCYRDSEAQRARIAYPGPAGIVDTELAPAAWQAIEDSVPLATELAADVEALIVYGRRGAATMSCYLVPITSVYDLAARLRATWRGWAGGIEAERELADYFSALAPLRGGTS